MIDQAAIEKAVLSIIRAIGDDPSREGLRDTPRRIAEMYAEIFAGMEIDPISELTVGFEEGHREMVVLKDIPFYSLCEHHFLPFYGVAHVGYIPNGRVVGASKLARVVEIFSPPRPTGGQVIAEADVTVAADRLVTILRAERII